MAQVPWTQWLTETGFVLCSYIEEVLGHPAMASMGRMRRRMAAASLLQLICGQISPVLLELPQLTQVMSVTMRALNETPQFEVSTSNPTNPTKPTNPHANCNVWDMPQYLGLAVTCQLSRLALCQKTQENGFWQIAGPETYTLGTLFPIHRCKLSHHMQFC